MRPVETEDTPPCLGPGLLEGERKEGEGGQTLQQAGGHVQTTRGDRDREREMSTHQDEFAHPLPCNVVEEIKATKVQCGMLCIVAAANTEHRQAQTERDLVLPG